MARFNSPVGMIKGVRHDFVGYSTYYDEIARIDLFYRRPGDEIYLALRNLGGSGLINHHDRLFLQFRHGKLAGWKEDYGRNWMWQ